MTEEELKAYKKNWYQKNKEKVLARKKEYRLNNLEKIKKYNKEYIKLHPERKNNIILTIKKNAKNN